ncbi:MAG TPA: hypothetical protein VE758_06750 [Chthoniobacterales bacterium]|nr:hypothetical protein [Chthoniobacterales bacterium]
MLRLREIPREARERLAALVRDIASDRGAGAVKRSAKPSVRVRQWQIQ